MNDLKVLASVTSDDVHDADSVPTANTGNCRYWGAWPDSPIPNVRLFVVFDREPTNEAEALACVNSHFGG